MPLELADSAALATMSDWAALPVFASGRYRMQSSADRETGAKPRLSLWTHGNRDMNHFVCRGQTDAPPSRVKLNVDLGRCEESYVRGMVLSRFVGSGRLARLWLTALSIRRAPADHELLRIYVDDDPTPRVRVPLREAIDGGAGEMFAPPFGAGSTRRMAWYYPVVFGSKLVVSLDGLGGDDLYFHQTAVVLDELPAARSAAAVRLRERDVSRQLLGAKVPAAGTASAWRARVEAGESTTRLFRGPATMVKARVRADRAALQDVRLTVRWDGGAPAIDLPFAELFTAGEISPERSSLALAATGDELSLQLPMPYAETASWTLTNHGTTAHRLEVVTEVVGGVPASPWGHLHVQHHETTTTSGKMHPLVRAEGRGRLVGVCMALHGHGLLEGGKRGHPMHFLEGDELGIVDGERALVGTGTEDYFNGAFYFQDGPTATPFAQTWGVVPRVAGAPNKARVNACRWHVLGDAVDFRESLQLDMEIGPGRPDVLDRYRSVAFLYR